MNSHKNILLVGGTGRNTGKTSLVCEVIKKFSTDYQIIALKITNHFHSANSKSFNLLEEKNPAANKDSSRMLLAGASKVFYIESGPDCLKEAFDTFLEKTVPGQIIVCESNGLSEIIKPGIYLMVDRNGNFEKKPSAIKAIPKVDAIVEMENGSFRHVVDKISLKNRQWHYKSYFNLAFFISGFTLF